MGNNGSVVILPAGFGGILPPSWSWKLQQSRRGGTGSLRYQLIRLTLPFPDYQPLCCGLLMSPANTFRYLLLVALLFVRAVASAQANSPDRIAEIAAGPAATNGAL